MSIQIFAFILLSQAPPDIVFELCGYQPEFNRSSEIDRVFSRIFFVTFPIFVMFILLCGPETNPKKLNIIEIGTAILQI